MSFTVPMKSKHALILLSILAVSSTQSALAKGGKDGGGGDIRGSTPEQISVAIQNVTTEPARDYMANPYNLYTTFWNIGLFRHSHHDPKGLTAVFNKMFAMSSAGSFPATAVYEDLKKTRFEVLTRGKCKANGTEKNNSASTQLLRNAPVCISVESLTTIPAVALESQLRALLAHEITHHFGFGETEANAIQDFLLYKGIGIVDSDHVQNRVNIPLTSLESELFWFNTKLIVGENATPLASELCLRVGKVVNLADSVVDAVKVGIEENRRNPYQPGDYASLLPEAEVIYSIASRMQGFCLPADVLKNERIEDPIEPNNRPGLAGISAALLYKVRVFGGRTHNNFYIH